MYTYIYINVCIYIYKCIYIHIDIDIDIADCPQAGTAPFAVRLRQLWLGNEPVRS